MCLWVSLFGFDSSLLDSCMSEVNHIIVLSYVSAGCRYCKDWCGKCSCLTEASVVFDLSVVCMFVLDQIAAETAAKREEALRRRQEEEQARSEALRRAQELDKQLRQAEEANARVSKAVGRKAGSSLIHLDSVGVGLLSRTSRLGSLFTMLWSCRRHN